MLSVGTRTGDLVARLGGDEFALWLEEADEAAALTKTHEFIEKSKKWCHLSKDENRLLGISIGVVVSKNDEVKTVDELVALADAAMYEVKHKGKGGVIVANRSDR